MKRYSVLARFWEGANQYEEVEKYYLKALEIREEKLGCHPAYFDTALALSNKARKLGHYELAIQTLCEAIKKLRYWEFQLILARQKGLDVSHLFQNFIHYALLFIVLGEALAGKISPEECLEDLRLLREKFPLPGTLREELYRQLGFDPGAGP